MWAEPLRFSPSPLWGEGWGEGLRLPYTTWLLRSFALMLPRSACDVFARLAQPSPRRGEGEKRCACLKHHGYGLMFISVSMLRINFIARLAPHPNPLPGGARGESTWMCSVFLAPQIRAHPCALSA
jgi:hypothetical protein